ncbi:hypothetical protein B4916_22390 [Yersinia intermedia]|nr:hypothetical protein B4916_22390 [Yersinia intermedia]
MNIGAQELSYASRATPDDFGRQHDCHFMGAYSHLSLWKEKAQFRILFVAMPSYPIKQQNKTRQLDDVDIPRSGIMYIP